MRHADRLAATLLLALPIASFAQVDDSSIPAPGCVQPVIPTAGTKLDKKAAEKFNGESNAYAACANAYIAERRAIANKHQAIASAQSNAANVFVKEFNTYADALSVFSKASAAAAAADAAKQ